MQFRRYCIESRFRHSKENKKRTMEQVISELVIADNKAESQSFSPIDDLKTTFMLLTIKLYWLPCLSGNQSESSRRGHQLEVPGSMKLLEEHSLSCVKCIINIDLVQKRGNPYAKTTIYVIAVIGDDIVGVEMKARFANVTYQKQT
eukprot:6572688-Ditylum_brightwellii.AAC.1